MTRRIFLAVPLPDNLKPELEKPLENLPGKITPVSNWHFTVQFLGQLDESLLKQLIDLLSRLDLGAAFPITIGGLGAFPDEQVAEVLWIGIEEGRKVFSRFAEQITEVLIQAGFKVNFRTTIPHLTIRRFSPPVDVSKWVKEFHLKPSTFEVSDLVVYESILRDRSPARYIPLATFKLQARPIN